MSKCNKVMLVVAEDLMENKRMCKELQIKIIEDSIVALVNEKQRLQKG